MINVKGYSIPNEPSELTVEQFDKINAITADAELDLIEKWINKFIYLGVGEEVFDEMELSELEQAVKDWNDQPPHPTEKVLTIEMDGYEYEAKPTIGVKDLGLIEKTMKLNTGEFGAEVLAILFKRSDLTKKEHYTNAHLKYKTKLFKNMSSDLLIPYILDVLNTLTTTAKTMSDGVTKQLEANND